ncbi:O-antigen translocase [Legionella micdadei]|uniref:Polysaccharide biosynthesis protein n=1 Tax=Legionella micdadei TaxID=451 RepID=A0A098GHD7_LEGMI|nr:O-antigen translocase [Legionella micdadei]ARG97149.1 O-antigen translocase [Legionella micdadei]ARH00590.1 O-antigen translocase [Legionella micdadei]KTD29254.1 lipopolysaccharide biosynthesis protein [Legionella micdadei]NSL17373.1 O-antigen translocase [Legionella micdadei]CEG61410.1 Polysaccharide biosynthesis protein [Legionella micdadei]
MTLIKTSLINAIAVGVRILSLLGINKLLALYVGPAGYAALGQFQNAVTMITTFASGALNSGVVKYTAEYYQDEEKQRAVWQTAGTIACIGSVFTSLLIVLFRKPLTSWFLHDEVYSSVFLWFAASLLLFVFNALFLAIMNGKKEIKRYVAANIAGSLLALLITSILVINSGLYGALVALAVFQSVAFFVSLFICSRATWFRLTYVIGKFDKQIARDLAKFTLMALTSAVCIPVSHLFIRHHLGVTIGWDAAGYWEAIWRFSAAYLLLITTTLSIYYLPRLSELNDPLALKKEIMQGYKIILPAVTLAALLIYLLRDLIINLLFSPEFYPARVLFLGQAVGDILKIGSWVLAYTMLSKAMTKYFILTEILFSISLYFTVVLMTNCWGLQAATWAYALNYLIYWIVMYFLIFNNLESDLVLCSQS